MPKALEPIICPNPSCKRKIEELIVVSDVSKAQAEKYYACPHCLTKVDWISTQLQKEEEKKENEEPKAEPPEMEEKGPPRCPNHFGYLAGRAEDAPIPQECLECPKVLDCVMKISDS